MRKKVGWAYMLKWSKRARLAVGILAVLISLALSWWLEQYLGAVALLVLLPGAGVFIYLNPELMKGG